MAPIFIAARGDAQLAVALSNHCKYASAGVSRQPVAELARDAERWMLASLGVMLPTGILLFLCFATKYYYLTAFWVKLTSLILVLAFTFTVRRRAIMSDERNMSAVRSKLVAVVSLSLWTSVALAGRLIGFP